MDVKDDSLIKLIREAIKMKWRAMADAQGADCHVLMMNPGLGDQDLMLAHLQETFAPLIAEAVETRETIFPAVNMVLGRIRLEAYTPTRPADHHDYYFDETTIIYFDPQPALELASGTEMLKRAIDEKLSAAY